MKSDEEPVEVRLGRNVRALRERLGWSQDRLAEMLSVQLDRDVKGVTVLRLEKGTRPTTVGELFALSLIFEIPAEDLLTKDSESIIEFSSLKTALRGMEEAHAKLQTAIENFRISQAMFDSEWTPDLGVLGPSPTVREVKELEKAWKSRKSALSVAEIERGDYLNRVKVFFDDPDWEPPF